VLDYVDIFGLSNFKLTTKNALVETSTGSGVANLASIEYSLEFWAFIYPYKAGTDFGTNKYLSVIWDKHTKITISTNTSGVFQMNCYPSVDYSNLSLYTTVFSQIPLNSYTWNYLRCSADSTASPSPLYSAKTDVSEIALQNFTNKYDFSSDTYGGAADLWFKKSSSLPKNWGYVFIAQLRLWNCYKCLSKFQHFIPIEGNSAFLLAKTTLVDIVNPVYDWNLAGYATKINEVKLLKNTGSFVPAVTADITTGYDYNVVDYTKYSKIDPILCVPNVNVCATLVKINELDTITFTQIPVAYQSRYTMEFWFWVNDTTKFSAGFNAVWKTHLSISLIQSNTDQSKLLLICFPQDYRVSPLGLSKGNITNLQVTTPNTDIQELPYSARTTDISRWEWVRCSVSGNLNQFYITSQTQANLPKKFKGEMMYKDYYAENSFRYFNPLTTSELVMDGASKNPSTLIFHIRNIYLFNEYIPNDNVISKNL